MPLIYFFLVFELRGEDFSVHPCWPFTMLARLPACGNGLSCALSGLSDCSHRFPITFHSALPWDSTKKILEQAEFCSPEVSACNCTIYLSYFPQDFDFHNPMSALFFVRSPDRTRTQTRNLGCFCWAVLTYLHISGWFSSSVSTGGD